MDATDSPSLLQVRLVVWTGEQLFEPLREGDFEAHNLRLALQNRVSAGVGENRRVEAVHDATMIRPHSRAHRLQTASGLVVELHVVPQRG